jgi:hypothetical protein
VPYQQIDHKDLAHTSLLLFMRLSRCLLPVNLPFFLIFFTGTMDAPAEGRYRHS